LFHILTSGFLPVLAVLCLAGTALCGESAAIAPADDFRPETWFHFVGANVSREGIAADLAAISAAGFSGVQFFHGRQTPPWPGVKEPTLCLSERWDGLVAFFAQETERRHLAFAMQNCPGWAMAGGPWIAPANAMRVLTASRTDFSGGAVEIDLARGPEPCDGAYPRWTDDRERNLDYRDLAVVVFPAPVADVPEAIPSDAPRGKLELAPGRHVVDYAFPAPHVLRTMNFNYNGWENLARCYDPDCSLRLEAKTAAGVWRKVLEAKLPAVNWQDWLGDGIDFALDETVAVGVRLTIENRDALSLLSAPAFYSGARKENWRGESGRSLKALIRRTDPGQDPAAFVRASIVRVFPGGTALRTRLPPGKWIALRIGHQNAMRRNGPAPAGATGWECDKLSRRGAEIHFENYVGRLLANGAVAGKLDTLLMDSWECNAQTWTDGLDETFRARLGYDLWRHAPALFGFVVDSPGETARFLTDWRRLLSDLVTENFYGRMGELAHEKGLKFQFETAFADVLPGDIMEYVKHADVPMCEYWYPARPEREGSPFFKPIKPTVSAARMYGKRRIAAEAFTSFDLTWTERLCDFRFVANRAAAEGVTRPVFHTYTHNPIPDSLPPGPAFDGGIGSPFMRKQTWWRFMPEFTRYLARLGEMLERGEPISDVLWFIGDEVDHRPPEIAAGFPAGYKYDYVNPDALLNRITVRGGRFFTQEGLSYSAMWVPSGRRMRAAVAERLAEFAESGAKIFFGEFPAESATLADGERETKKLTAALARLKVAARVADDLAAELKRLAPPDLLGNGVFWSHRRDDAKDFYFIAAADPAGGAVSVSSRLGGPCEIWDPVTGKRRPPDLTAVRDGRTEAAFVLPPSGAVFLVFPKNGEVLDAVAAAPVAVEDLSAGWTLAINGRTFRLDALRAWRELPAADEATHAFSGTATYSRLFGWAGTEKVTLDFGAVDSCLAVRVNDVEIARLWCPPYVVEIPAGVLRKGENILRAEVCDTWHNRLVYDAAQPEEKRKTWILPGPKVPKAGDALLPSGLRGPVKLVRTCKSKVGRQSEAVASCFAL